MDSEKIGVMGHSAGAQILLLWIGSRKSPAGAAVSLDTTAEYDTPGTVAHKYLFNAMRKLPGPKIPILLFASQARRPRFENFDRYLSKSPRYEAAAAELRHDDFLTHGFLGRALMNSPDADAVRKSYEQVCRTIRRFFDATLNKDAESERLLQQGEHGAPVSVRFRPALSRAKTANDAATSR